MQIKMKSIFGTLFFFSLIAQTTFAGWGSGTAPVIFFPNSNGSIPLTMPIGVNTHFAQVIYWGGMFSQQGTFFFDPYAPTCATGISPTGWSNTDVQAFVTKCDDRCQGGNCGTYAGQTLSGCSSTASLNGTIRNHQETFTAQATDNAGNSGTCSTSPPAFIDRLPPIVTPPITIEHQGLEIAPKEVSYDPNNPTPYRANDGIVELSFQAQDDPSTTWNGLRSGVSGINMNEVRASSGVQSAITDHEQQVQQLQEEINSFAEAIRIREEQVATLENEIQDIEVENIRRRQEIAKIQESIDNLEAEITTILEELPTLERQLPILQETITSHQATILELEKTKEALIQDIQILDQEINNLTNEISTLTQEINDLNLESPLPTDEIASKQTLLDQKQATLNEKQTLKRTKEGEVNIIEQDINKKQSEIIDYQTEIDKINQLLENPDQNILDREETIGYLEQNKEIWETRLSLWIEGIARRTAEIQKWEAVLSDYAQETAIIKDKINQLNQQISEKKNNLSAGNTSITKIWVKRKHDSKNESFIDPTIDTSNAPNFKWNLNQHQFNEEKYPLLAKTGYYEIFISVQDEAGNQAQSPTFYIEVFPANADTINTTFTDNCDDQAFLANNIDTCHAQVILRDPYENLIDNRGNIIVEVAHQNTEGNYTITDNPSAVQTFINGLRFDQGVFNGTRHQLTWPNPLPKATEEFDLRALAPTIKLITNPTNQKIKLTQVVPQDTKIQFTVPTADKDGSILDISSFVRVPIKVVFEPWIKLFLSDNPDNAAPTNPLQFLLGQEQTIYEYADTQFENYPLPPKFDVATFGHAPEKTIFRNLDLSKAEGFTLEFKANKKTKEKSIFTHLKSKGGELGDISVAFTSQVTYPVDDSPKPAKTISYPGGNLGNNVGGLTLFEPAELEVALVSDDTPIEGIIIGADIEGQVITKTDTNYTIQRKGNDDDPRLLRMGGISAADVREEITRKAYDLIRGQAPSSANHFDITNFEPGGVTYFKGKTVVIEGGSISSGGHTVVIEDGNLYITGDMTYNSHSDTLGIVLVNTQAHPRPETGNIFIHNSVKKTVGTFYSDGSVTSTVVAKNTTPSITTPLDRDSKNASNTEILGRQLLHEGTLLTRNTLGGGMLEPFLDPWGILDDSNYALVETRAQLYDLHFVRRYYPQMDKDGNQTNIDDCVTLPDGNCDPNRHAFVIRPDGRVQNSPPPGFEIY